MARNRRKASGSGPVTGSQAGGAANGFRDRFGADAGHAPEVDRALAAKTRRAGDRRLEQLMSLRRIAGQAGTS